MEALSGRSCCFGASLVKPLHIQSSSKSILASKFVGTPLQLSCFPVRLSRDPGKCSLPKETTCSALGPSRVSNPFSLGLPNPGKFGLDDDAFETVGRSKNGRGARIVCQSLKMEDKYKSLKARRLLREMEEVRDQRYDQNGKSIPWGKPKKKNSGNEGKKKSEMDGDHNGIAPWSKRMRINYGDDVEEQDYGLDYWEDDKQNVAAMRGKYRQEVTKGGGTYGGQFARENRGSKRTIIDTADMAKLVAERPGTKAALATGVAGYVEQFDPEVLERGSALFEDPAEVQQRMGWYLESLGVDVETIDLSKVPGTGEEQEEKVEYLKELGLAQEDVANIIQRWPQLLRLSLRKNIKPVIKYLESKWIAFKPSQIVELLRKYPQILYHSIELTLQPRVLYLRGLGLTRSQSQDVFLRVPSLFDTRIERAPSTNVAYMSAMGLEIADMWKVVYGCPEVLVRRVNEFLKPRWLGIVNHLGLCEDEARWALLQTPELLLVEDVGVLRKELRTELRRRGLCPGEDLVETASEESVSDAGVIPADCVRTASEEPVSDAGVIAAEFVGTASEESVSDAEMTETGLVGVGADAVKTASEHSVFDTGVSVADLVEAASENSASDSGCMAAESIRTAADESSRATGVSAVVSVRSSEKSVSDTGVTNLLLDVEERSVPKEGSGELSDVAEGGPFGKIWEGVKGDPSSAEHEGVEIPADRLLRDGSSGRGTTTESGLRQDASVAAEEAAEVSERFSETRLSDGEVSERVSETRFLDGAEAGPSGQEDEPQIHLSRVIALFGHRLHETGVKETLDRTLGLLETELGLDADGLRTVLAMYPGVLELGSGDIRDKVEMLRSEGLQTEDIRRMVVGQPDWLALDLEGVLTPKLEYLKTEMGRGVNELVEFPAFLCYSLRKRIARRHQLAQDSSGKIPLRTLIGSTRAQFDEAVERNEWGFDVEELDEPEEAWTVERAYLKQRWEQAKIGAGPVGGLV